MAQGAPGPAPEPGFGLYIHWPFCKSKCPYCDFNSHVREGVDHDRWQRGLLAEMAHMAARSRGRTLTSIFFGGGTPSLMPPALVAALLEGAARHWAIAPDVEISLEANPTSVEAANFAALASAGVNRVSLGVQALDDRALRFLGRAHSADEALQAVDLAARHFARHSLDLIYARPGQSVAGWRDELNRALPHVRDHISLYTLTIEANTGFAGAVKRGEFTMPDDEAVAAFYDATQEVCASAGLPAYEVSNHAAPGAACRHNLTYWRYGAYAGIGPGAHGRLPLPNGRLATRQLKRPENWLDQVEQRGDGTEGEERITGRAAAEEALLMGLRLDEGVHEANLRAATGLAFADLVDAAAVRHLEQGGLLRRGAGWMGATPAGRQVLDGLLGRLIA